MIESLSVLALLLLAIAMALPLAHALELPGKHRLDEATYKAVQGIYYPGFTVGGIVGELGGMAAILTVMLLTPAQSVAFGWVAAALLLLLTAHLVYWVVTHPSNRAWLEQTQLTGAAKLFFWLFSTESADWRCMRKTWEYSHLARACLAVGSFLCMTIATVT